VTQAETVTSLAILGCTGSVGTAALDVARRHRDRVHVAGLGAGGNLEVLRAQVREFRPELVSVARDEDAQALRKEFPDMEVLAGAEGAEAVAAMPSADVVLAAIVGAAGLRSTFAAASSGKRVALANKESMVIAGALMWDAARASGADVIPVDSEHSAVFQCLRSGSRGEVRKIILTASGGPFLRRDASTFSSITPREALKHPTWDMGEKITIDSATLMNKGLEVIEAHFLFGFRPEQIRILVHPQSVVHSMVEYVDGSIMAHLGRTDMRIPIRYALFHPERADGACEPFDLAGASPLEFLEPDAEKFPCIRLAYEALERGGSAPAALNAANEAAVGAFLREEIPFTAVPQVNESVLGSWDGRAPASVDDVLAADEEARKRAGEAISKLRR
jgi:1-deoxy-D-xylulose-5-phosphate reductoisomerase